MNETNKWLKNVGKQRICSEKCLNICHKVKNKILKHEAVIKSVLSTVQNQTGWFII